MKDDEDNCCIAKIAAAFKLVGIVAESLGYEYAELRPCRRDSRKCVCVFRRAGCFDCLKMETAGKQLETAELDMPSSSGKIPLAFLYCDLARELYRILDNGGVLKANYDLECNEKSEKSGGSIAAADVPEFMIKCVLHNLV